MQDSTLRVKTQVSEIRKDSYRVWFSINDARFGIAALYETRADADLEEKRLRAALLKLIDYRGNENLMLQLINEGERERKRRGILSGLRRLFRGDVNWRFSDRA